MQQLMHVMQLERGSIVGRSVHFRPITSFPYDGIHARLRYNAHAPLYCNGLAEHTEIDLFCVQYIMYPSLPKLMFYLFKVFPPAEAV